VTPVRVPAAVFFVALALGCAHAPPDSADPVVARTDEIVLRRSDIERWDATLGNDRAFRRRLAQAGGRDEAVARQAALASILAADSPDLVSEAERRKLLRDLADQTVDRTYNREILAPRITIDPGEVRSIFEEHRENYRKARGVTVLEIFLWAPEDLPELRRKKRAMLENVRTEVTDQEAFRRKAEALSDATNAYRGGSIGTVLDNQVGGALRTELFTGRTGLTDIVESPEGLFLFWVTRVIPPRDNSFPDVADDIERRLRSRRLTTLITEDTERLRADHDIRLIPPAEGVAAANGPILSIDDRPYTLEDLDLDRFDRRTVDRRALAVVHRRVLETAGIAIDPPDRTLFDFRIGRTTLARLVERQAAAGEAPTAAPPAPPGEPELQRWTFEMLRIPGADRPDQLSKVFRALYQLGPDAGLEDLAELLEDLFGMKGTLTAYDDVPASSIAGLGPEIHTTIKKRLEPGRLSKPLHLADRHEIVVIELEARRVDQEATAERAKRGNQRRSREEIEQRLSDELLERHDFRMIRRP